MVATGRGPLARRILAVLAAAIVPAVAALELVGEAAVATRAVSAAEWDRVAIATTTLSRGGALVVVVPRWAEPHLRQRLGDDVMPIAHLARSDTARFPFAVEVGLHGEHAADLARFDPVEETVVGPFVVRRLANRTSERVLFDFVDGLRPPDASVRGTDPEVHCAWSARSRVIAGGLGGRPALPRERFECPGPPWAAVAVTVVADQSMLPRRCIWAQPFDDGDKVLRFERVPLAGARRLVGHHGMEWLMERDGAGAAVTLEARMDGASLGRAVHREGDGWSSFAFDLPAKAAEGGDDRTATFELAVSGGPSTSRHLCVEATLR